MPESPEGILAAGAVLWRHGAEGPEVALVHRPRYDDWSFPKGKYKKSEHPVHAAVREVWEETGVWPVLGRRLGAFGIARVFSSATARCLETMLPYAARTGADICTDWAFTVGTSKRAGDRFAELLAEDVPAMVCTHGELVPELIRRACEELGAE